MQPCVTLYKAENDAFRQVLKENGFTVSFVPVLDFKIVEYQLQRMIETREHLMYNNIIITSSQVVTALEKMEEKEEVHAWFQDNACWIVGNKTKIKLQNMLGFTPSQEIVADNAATLVEKMKNIKGNSIFLCGNRAIPTIPDSFLNMNMPLRKLVTYETLLIPQKEAKLPPGCLCFFSPSGVSAVLSSSPKISSCNFFVAFGKTTASALLEHGINIKSVIVCAKPTPESLVESIREGMSEK